MPIFIETSHHKARLILSVSWRLWCKWPAAVILKACAPPAASSVDGYAAQKSGAETALTEPQNRKWLSAETRLSRFYFFTWLRYLADETPLVLKGKGHFCSLLAAL